MVLLVRGALLLRLLYLDVRQLVRIVSRVASPREQHFAVLFLMVVGGVWVLACMGFAASVYGFTREPGVHVV